MLGIGVSLKKKDSDFDSRPEERLLGTPISTSTPHTWLYVF